MSITQLFGKCRELGYCDCGGILGCTDDTAPKRKKGNMDTETPIEKLEGLGGFGDDFVGVEIDIPEIKPSKRDVEVAKKATKPNDTPGNPCRWCSRRGEPCKRHGGGESQTYPHRKKSEKKKVLKTVPSVETVELDIGDLKITYTRRVE